MWKFFKEFKMYHLSLSLSTLSVVFVLEMLFAYWGTGLLNDSIFLIGFISPFYI